MLTLLVVVTVDTLTGTLGGAGPTTRSLMNSAVSLLTLVTVTVVLAMETVLSWAAQLLWQPELGLRGVAMDNRVPTNCSQ